MNEQIFLKIIKNYDYSVSMNANSRRLDVTYTTLIKFMYIMQDKYKLVNIEKINSKIRKVTPTENMIKLKDVVLFAAL